jgi:site-specific recombinase XerD
VTHLRQLMLDELQRRNYSPSTVRCYIRAVEDFSKYFHRSPERLGPRHIREYQVHLFRDRKLSPGTIQSRCAALMSITSFPPAAWLSTVPDGLIPRIASSCLFTH